MNVRLPKKTRLSGQWSRDASSRCYPRMNCHTIIFDVPALCSNWIAGFLDFPSVVSRHSHRSTRTSVPYQSRLCPRSRRIQHHPVVSIKHVRKVELGLLKLSEVRFSSVASNPPFWAFSWCLLAGSRWPRATQNAAFPSLGSCCSVLATEGRQGLTV